MYTPDQNPSNRKTVLLHLRIQYPWENLGPQKILSSAPLSMLVGSLGRHFYFKRQGGPLGVTQGSLIFPEVPVLPMLVIRST